MGKKKKIFKNINNDGIVIRNINGKKRITVTMSTKHHCGNYNVRDA